ncbi:hypothetical protein M758_12G136600, partial [Ceratodon purpureus]
KQSVTPSGKKKQHKNKTKTKQSLKVILILILILPWHKHGEFYPPDIRTTSRDIIVISLMEGKELETGSSSQVASFGEQWQVSRSGSDREKAAFFFRLLFSFLAGFCQLWRCPGAGAGASEIGTLDSPDTSLACSPATFPGTPLPVLPLPHLCSTSLLSYSSL